MQDQDPEDGASGRRAYELVEDYGFYWLMRDAISLIYYVFFYIAALRRVGKRSLRTSERKAAAKIMNRILHSGFEGDPIHLIAPPPRVDVATVLDAYRDAKSGIASHEQIEIAGDHLKRALGRIEVEAWRRQHQRDFEASFLAAGHAKTHLSRVVGVLRAAFNHAEQEEMILRAPRIIDPCTDEDRDAAPLKGRLLSFDEIARLIDAVDTSHALDYFIGLVNSAARPVAICECDPAQIDWQLGIFDLNPPGRTQTKKRRPTIRVTQTWEPWLRGRPPGPLIRYNGQPVRSMKTAVRAARDAAALKPDAAGVHVNGYSIRHTLGRHFEDCDVPLIERSLWLGHIKTPKKKSTERYSPANPRNPDFLRRAAAAVEQFVREIDARTRKWDLLRPYTVKPGWKP
jgi:hypothetical protein